MGAQSGRWSMASSGLRLWAELEGRGAALCGSTSRRRHLVGLLLELVDIFGRFVHGRYHLHRSVLTRGLPARDACQHRQWQASASERAHARARSRACAYTLAAGQGERAGAHKRGWGRETWHFWLTAKSSLVLTAFAPRVVIKRRCLYLGGRSVMESTVIFTCPSAEGGRAEGWRTSYEPRVSRPRRKPREQAAPRAHPRRGRDARTPRACVLATSNLRGVCFFLWR